MNTCTKIRNQQKLTFFASFGVQGHDIARQTDFFIELRFDNRGFVKFFAHGSHGFIGFVTAVLQIGQLAHRRHFLGHLFDPRLGHEVVPIDEVVSRGFGAQTQG